MRTIKNQKGVATILLVLLIGISVMLITAGVAKSLSSKKETSVAAHAQTNAKLMGWSGVSAFRAYLLNLGGSDLTNIRSLHQKTIPLRPDDTINEIIAKNIKVEGCLTAEQPCVVKAEISSNNIAAQAATTIEAVYELTINNNQVSTAAERVVLSFTGNTFMSGTTLVSEVPNAKVILNVDGNTNLASGFKLENISELTVNSTGDVIIDCTTSQCSNTKININALGRVDLQGGGVYGDIRSNNIVSIASATGTSQITKVNNIYTTNKVYLTGNTQANLIHANGDVLLTSTAKAEDIYSNGNIELSFAQAKNLYAQGYVSLSAKSIVSGDVNTQKYLYMSGALVGTTTEIKGNAKVYEYVDMISGAKIYGSVYAKGQNTVGNYNAAVRLSSSWIGGSIFANPNVVLLDIWSGIDVVGNVIIKGKVTGLLNGTIYNARQNIGGIVSENQTNIPQLDFTIPRTVIPESIRDYILSQVDFKTKVDVRVYKNDANYIFTRTNGFDRVYLNHLKIQGTNTTYMYKDGKQISINNQGVATVISNNGFAIADYRTGNNIFEYRTYTGAICLVAKSGRCDSDIIGYLPRISVGKTLGIDNDFDYIETTKTWIVRTTSSSARLDNAVLAPGVMYFEGNLVLTGNANWNADSMSNAYTNSFLAEGSIDAIAASPRIYSPYNVIRSEQASLICDRTLKTINNAVFDIRETNPKTLSNKYLVPTNLCKGDNEFSYTMNRNTQGEKLKVQIDGEPIDKLDLGYVALMGNTVVRIGACAQIYGDVLSRGTIEGSAACGATSNKNQIVGSLSSQGNAPYINGINQSNTFGAGTKIVVPDPKYTNAKNNPGGSTVTVPSVNAVSLHWSKYK